jgi:hypothetical protein
VVIAMLRRTITCQGRQTENRWMKRLGSPAWLVATLVAVSLPIVPAVAQEHEATNLAKAAQNPIANMISVPIQYNLNMETGPFEKPQHLVNIQPVYPVKLNADWNLITRTIVPVLSQPAFTAEQDREFGIGDIQFSAFLSPKEAVDGWIWGVGAIAQLDSATNDRLGQGVWGLGPTAVALHLGKSWVYGALINNVWSVAQDDGRPAVNQMLLQPFVNYNFPDAPGRYLAFSPIITANWKADSGQQWTVPLGIGIGQIFKIGKQPLNAQAGYYYNVERPDDASRYQIRLQLSFLFPK